MTVLITGANIGIIKAFFDGYAARGENTLGTHRGPEDGKMLQLDVTDPASQCALATRTKGSHADLQCGRRSGQKLESGYPSAMWEAAFAANVTSVFMTIQSMLSNLRLSKAPKIAIISS